MGTRYNSIKAFGLRHRDSASRLLLAERVVFEEMAELMLEPLEVVGPSWQEEEKSPQILLIARLFNDFEAAKELMLGGLLEQANMPLRDTIECMLLLRLFQAKPERGMRWVKNLSEHAAGAVYKELQDLGIEAVEYTMYSSLSHQAHANFLGSASRVKEDALGGGRVHRQFHFGAHRNDSMLSLAFRGLLVQQELALAVVLPTIYGPDLSEDFGSDWFSRVRDIIPKLTALGIEMTADPTVGPEPNETPKEGAIRDLVGKRLRVRTEFLPQNLQDQLDDKTDDKAASKA